MFNRAEEDVNSFRRLFQENIMAFNKNAQVCKSKLQSCTEPSRVVHVMHCANKIQSNDILENVLKAIEKENV